MPLSVGRVLTEHRMIIPITALYVDVAPPIVHAALSLSIMHAA
jgi:hypothetical protein